MLDTLPLALGQAHEFSAALLAPIGVVGLARLALLIAGAVPHRIRQGQRPAAKHAISAWPKVTVLVPAYNEEKVLAGAVRSTLKSDYPALEVLIIDDGSTDCTLEIAHLLANEDPRVRVLAQVQNGGKAAALNAGVRAANAEFIVTVDADTLLAPDAVRELVLPMLDSDVAAVAGNLKVGNRINLITLFQSIEYVSGLNLLRRAQDTFGFVTTISGAVGAFRRDAVLAVGGFSTDTLVEDSDLSVELLQAGAKIVFNARAKAYTEAPETLSSLFRQRSRWMAGFMQLLWKHRSAMLSGKPWASLGFPNLIIMFVLFPLAVPAFYVANVFGLMLHPEMFPAVMGMLGIDIALTAACYAADGEDARELAALPAWWLCWPGLVFCQFLQAFRKLAGVNAHSWDKLKRTARLIPST